MIDNEFNYLINTAKRIAVKRDLSPYAFSGMVGCALETKSGHVYTGVSLDSKCDLGNCAEYAAIAEMLKNNESEIVRIVAYSSRGKVYPPCGRCRELIRMVNENNLNAKVMVSDDRVCLLRDLLPEMYVTKSDSNPVA